MEKKYSNLGFYMLLLIPLTFAGYYKSYISQIPHFNAYIKPAHHIHATIALLWLILLISQALLIRYKKISLHKKIGKSSIFLFGALMLSFIPIIHVDSVIIFPIADMILLLVFYSLGMTMIHRKRTAEHIRYMICLSLVFLDPTLGRVVFTISGLMGYSTLAVHHITLGTISVILLILIFYDRAHHRNYKPYLVALPLFTIYQILFQVLYI